MGFQIDHNALAPLIRAVAQEVVSELRDDEHRLDKDRLAYPEAEAAALMGVPRHRLRDARLRGELKASRIGKVLVYEDSELRAFLRRQRLDA